MALAAAGQARPPIRCKADYSYAGVQSASPTSGIRADLTVLALPTVRAGHVGGWIGVGGPGSGPGGADQWLQVGYAGFPDGSLQLFYEVTLPGAAPEYHVVRPDVRLKERHLVSIREVLPGAWRAWVDGTPATPVYRFRGSHGKYAPEGMGETWQPRAGACNTYAWKFGTVRVAMRPGGIWVKGRSGDQWQDRGYGVKIISPDSFETIAR